MSGVTPSEYVRSHREELVTLTLDLLAVDTSNPPGDTRAIVTEIEQFLEPLSIDVDRFAVDPAKPNVVC